MARRAIAILETGLVCGVGLSAAAACAAIRCALDNFQETRFVDRGGEWLVGSSVPLVEAWQGRAKLLKMLALAVSDCVERAGMIDTTSLPLLLCVAEPERPGRLQRLEALFRDDLEAELRLRFHQAESAVFAQGRFSIVAALARARVLIHEHGFSQVLIAATDSLLVGPTLSAFDARERLRSSKTSNGFIPGEAAGAVLVGTPTGGAQLLCTGLGSAIEDATIDADLPLRANGLTRAIKAALSEADCALGDLNFRIADASGEQYYFKEASLALSRTLRKRKEHFYIWHPADCIGEVGAAIGPVMLSVVLAASRKDYSSGPGVLAHVSNDAGQRGVAILQWMNG